MDISEISPAELAELHLDGRRIDLIDVCTPLEFREVHIEFARNVPLNQLDPASLSRSGEPLFIICRSGIRSRQACEQLRKAGVANVISVDGGTAACKGTTLPVVRGKKAISLDRQVRLVIGGLVLLGNLAGLLYHPAFFCLSIFMGAGLIFAGITDTCALGMLLARMPWNRCNPSETSICNY